MNIVHITPGAGGMFCGGCFRDNALVAELRKLGHNTLMVPVYLPLTLEEENQAEGTPIFFGGISVYLEQKVPFFAKAPRWIHKLLASPTLLKWAAGNTAKTRAEDLGELTLSMLNGEVGKQAAELEVLVKWLQQQEKPDVVCLSNALLVGMARRLKAALNVPIVCTFQGEDSFLDGLPTLYREKSWAMLAERSKEVDCFISPSRYYAALMQQRLGLKSSKLSVIYNGIHLEGYGPEPAWPEFPTIGFFARMCRDKGLDRVVDAFLLLRKSPEWKNLRLLVGGGCGPGDEAFVAAQKQKIEQAGVAADVSFFPNLTREQKQDFLRRISVFCTPAMYGEAFGLYLVEAFASGVPVVQPPHASFPELLQISGAGVLAASGEPADLALALGDILKRPEQLKAMGKKARHAALELFDMSKMAQEVVNTYRLSSSR